MMTFSKEDCGFLWKRLQIRLDRPHMFAPPACLEFSLCAVLDAWTTLAHGEHARSGWRDTWQAEREALHGSARDRFLSDPVGCDPALLVTYATASTLKQSYRQVVEGGRRVYERLCDHYNNDNTVSIAEVEALRGQLGFLIEEALSDSDSYGQPAGLEGYLGELLSIFEALLRPDRTPTVAQSEWRACLDKLVFVPIHVRHLWDTLSVQERSRREQAIPAAVWEQSQSQVVLGFQRIVQHLLRSEKTEETIKGVPVVPRA